jgi:phenylpropionate dioxygenase-like ring-hydroxylating dioxygenase large terminal subunit
MTNDALETRLLERLNAGETQLAAREYQQPVRHYTDPRVLAAERAALFENFPLVVGTSVEMPEPGSFRTIDIEDQSVLVVRQPDRSLKAFHNVCRHRAYRVEHEEAGCRQSFRCSFHSWTYRTDGSLLHIPSPEGFPNLDRECRGLAELPVAERHGLVWVGPMSHDKLDIDDFLADAGPVLAAMRIDEGGLFRREQFALNANWKLVIDTFLETYHIKHLHRNTVARAVESISVTEPLGLHARLLAPKLDWHKLEPTERNFDADINVVLRLWPNTIALWVHDHAELYVAIPDGEDPNRCLVTQYLMTPDPEVPEADVAKWEHFWDLAVGTTRAEDFAAAEIMQVNFRSGNQSHLTFGRNEPGLHYFHDHLRDLVPSTADLSTTSE